MLDKIVKILVIVALLQWIYIHLTQTLYVHQDIQMEIDYMMLSDQIEGTMDFTDEKVKKDQ